MPAAHRHDARSHATYATSHRAEREVPRRRHEYHAARTENGVHLVLKLAKAAPIVLGEIDGLRYLYIRFRHALSRVHHDGGDKLGARISKALRGASEEGATLGEGRPAEAGCVAHQRFEHVVHVQITQEMDGVGFSAGARRVETRHARAWHERSCRHACQLGNRPGAQRGQCVGDALARVRVSEIGVCLTAHARKARATLRCAPWSQVEAVHATDGIAKTLALLLESGVLSAHAKTVAQEVVRGRIFVETPHEIGDAVHHGVVRADWDVAEHVHPECHDTAEQGHRHALQHFESNALGCAAARP
jgi:hypothetical protein